MANTATGTEAALSITRRTDFKTAILAPEDTPEDSPPETECLSAKIQLDNIEHTYMSKFAVENRQLFYLVRQQELLLGLAYVYPKDKIVFKLFPRVLKIKPNAGNTTCTIPYVAYYCRALWWITTKCGMSLVARNVEPFISLLINES
jgi:hypothetical protein